MPNVFAVPVFFICMRECLETSIIVSILLAFLKQTLGPERDAATYKKLVRQVWWGTGLGLAICICIGAGMIGAFYGIGLDAWGSSEDVWEGAFSLVAAVVITIMGAALLRVSKLQDKWRVKIAKAVEAKGSTTGKNVGSLRTRFKRWCEKYAMFILPFVTVLREGLEAVVFIGGVSLGLPATAFPLAVICGLGAGALIGWFIYKGGNIARIQIFLIISTCFLYLISAGLFSKAIWAFENHEWTMLTGGDAAETGSGPGSYDIRKSVWHVNCCNPEIYSDGGWGIFNSLFGWQNSATIGSVLGYNLYWLLVIVSFLALGYREKKGHWPLMKPKERKLDGGGESDSEASIGRAEVLQAAELEDKSAMGTGTREITQTPSP